MNTLPPLLRKYLFFIYTSAVTLSLFCIYFGPRNINYQAVLIFTCIAIIADFKQTSFKGTFQTTVTAIFMCSIFLSEPIAVILIAILSTIPSDIFYGRSWYKICFNVSYRVIIFGVPALLLNMMGVNANNIHEIGILGVIVVAASYISLSITMISIVISLADNGTIKDGIRDSVRFFNYHDISLIPYGLILAWLWHFNPWYFFVGLLPLVAMQRSFALQASLLVEQESTARLANQQRQIQDATTTLLSSKDIHEQLDTLLQHVMDVFPITSANVLLWDSWGAVDRVVSRGADRPELPIEGWSDKLRQVSDARRTVRLDHEFVTRVMDGRPVLLVPLVTPNDVVGCMVLVAEDSFALDDQGERLIETFAAQAALAIYQARLIQQLKSSQVQIVQSERLAAIGTLAAGVAHEFNNLLAGISGIAQLAVMEDNRDEQVSALNTVAQAAQQGGSITRGLLTFARHIEPKRELSNIRDAIEPVLSMLNGEFRRSNVEVIRDIEPVTPIVCDVGMLAQVMMNLVTNALDAMQPDGGTLRIGLREQDHQIWLSVSDTGSGIPSHVRDRIFEPFVSTKTSSDGKLHGGTGLGLAISYGIVTDHGGTIDVESGSAGTTMTVRLPMSSSNQHVSLSQRRSNEPLRVLVVDDEPLIAKSLHGMLLLEGHEARWYTEPVKALEALGDGEVDVIFADLMMPEMDGITLLQHARQHVPDARHVVVTGQVEQRQLDRVRSLGVAAVIEKPFSIDAVRAVVEQMRVA
jgi:two-component system, NtrC family, sensor kinase